MSEYVIIPDEDYSDDDGEIILVPYGKRSVSESWLMNWQLPRWRAWAAIPSSSFEPIPSASDGKVGAWQL